MKANLANIPLSDIDIGERFRKVYPNINGLIHSIKTKGLITPVAVGLSEIMRTEHKSDKKYTLLAGGRRMAAITEMGWTTIPAKIYDQPLSELDFRAIELAENIDREAMTYNEETQLKLKIHRLQQEIHGPKYGKSPDAAGWSQADTARLLNETPTNLTRDMKLAQAIEQFPNIGLDKQKNKSDAMKLLNSIGKKLILEKKSATFTQNVGPSDKLFTKLCQNYMIGDCFKMMESLPANSMDFIEVDPPYGMDLHAKKSKGVMLGYNEVDAKDYVDFLERLFIQCYRIMRPNSWLVCWFAPDPWFHTVSTLLKEVGFTLSMITGSWVKPTGQTMQPELALANCREDFFYCRKGYPKLNKPGRSNVFAFNPVSPTKKIHPTERPLPLMTELYSTFNAPNSTAFIPFLGSGVGLMAAHTCQMNALGTDMSEEFKPGYIVNLKTYLDMETLP